MIDSLQCFGRDRFKMNSKFARKYFLWIVLYTGLFSVVFAETLDNVKLIRKKRVYGGFEIGKLYYSEIPEDVEVFGNSGEFPFMAELLRGGKRICGAVIVRDNVVLTAAHCMKGILPFAFSVRAGTYKAEPPAIFYSQTRNVTAYVCHPSYNYSNPLDFGYDISVLFLDRNFTLNLFVNTIQIAKYHNRLKSVHKTSLVLGWGQTENYYSSNQLLAAEVIMLDLQECRKLFGNDYYIRNSVLCTISIDLNKGPCHGDSGGPLFRRFRSRNNSEYNVLLGITDSSFKNRAGNCLTNRPSLYTDLASFREWIWKVMQNDAYYTSDIQAEQTPYGYFEKFNKK